MWGTIAGFVGVLGVAVGALLNAWLVTRRERRTKQREAYSAVLIALQQIRLAYRRLEALHELHLPVADAEALRVLQEQVRAKEPEFKELRDGLVRAAAVARVTLNARAVAELERYEVADALATNTSGIYEKLAARRGAAMESSDRLVEIARAELGLRKLPRRPQ